MSEDSQVAEILAASDMRQPFAQVGIPDTLPGGLGGRRDHPLAFVEHQTLDKHQIDERHPIQTRYGPYR